MARGGLDDTEAIQANPCEAVSGGAPRGNRNAAGPHTVAPESAELTALVVLLRDVCGLSWAQIVARLSHDFGIELSRAAVWQRYRRGKQNG